jgi:molybdate transport system ATP-binding protein
VLRVEARTRLGALALDVALEVEAGECLAVAGPSGAGKTSVLRVAAGLLRPEHGLVEAGGETWLDTRRGTDLPPERRRCGYLFQEYALFPHLTAWQNVAYPLSGVPRRERRRRALDLLERFGMGELAEARPRTLSGGERQRVALARALARRPGVLLLDEPVAALDARTRAGALRELGAVLREVEVPALLVTHDFAEAAQLGDRVGVIDAGRVVQEGTPSELAAAPRSAFVADFTGAVVLTGTARGGADGLTHVELDGGGAVASTDRAEGPVAVSVYPWEIAIEPAGEARHGSTQNRLAAEVLSVTTVGNRVRLGLAAPQPLAAELTRASAETLGLRAGLRVTASWKAAATRLVGL